jgi:hypothetical protein
MAKVLQFRRGTTAELASITGAVGELFVDTTKDTVVVHDGSTQGGFPLQRELVSGTSIKTINGNSVLGSGNIIISGDGAGFDQSLNTTDDVTFASVGIASEILDDTITWNSADYSPSSPTSLTPQISVYFWNAAFNSFVNSLNTGDKFSVFSSSLGWVTFTFVSSVSIPSGTAINVEESIPSFSDIPSGPGLKKIVSNPVQPILVSGTNIKTINNQSILGSGNITIEGGEGGSADLSQIAEDVLPVFSDVYDIGSTDKRWYDGYFSNKVDINGAEILGSEDGVVIPNAALIDQLLISDNMITPDDSTSRQYLGDKGVVVINGNLVVDGDWLLMPVVESTPLITGSEGMIHYNKDISAFQAYNGTSWELLERVTTPPTTITKDNSGFVDIDFTGAMLGTYTRTDGAAAFAFRGNNYLAGSRVTIRVIENSGFSGGVFLNFPSDWVFVGTKPEQLATGKTALLTVTSFGTTEADCVAQWWVQS